MVILSHILMILLCCAALGKGAGWLVDSAVRIAQRLGISQLVIGLTIVAFGTSAPEFAVTINAAIRGHEAISVGNVVGSNIFNIGFILGGCALVGTIKIRRALVLRDGILLLAVTAGLFLMFYDGRLVRWEGVVLFIVLIAYLVYLAYKREPVMEDDLPSGPAGWKDLGLLLLGLGVIIGGGHFLVDSAKVIAEAMGLSPWVIGVTVVAAGTSVPEFVISLVALLKKHHGISAGNLIGSNLFNTLGVLGVAGAIRPMTVNRDALISVALLIGLTALVLVFLRTGWRLARWEGAMLVLVSLAIWTYIIYNSCPG